MPKLTHVFVVWEKKMDANILYCIRKEERAAKTIVKNLNKNKVLYRVEGSDIKTNTYFAFYCKHAIN